VKNGKLQVQVPADYAEHHVRGWPVPIHSGIDARLAIDCASPGVLRLHQAVLLSCHKHCRVPADDPHLRGGHGRESGRGDGNGEHTNLSLQRFIPLRVRLQPHRPHGRPCNLAH